MAASSSIPKWHNRGEADTDPVKNNGEKILAAVRKLTRHTEQANRIKKITEYDEHDQTFELTEFIQV